MDRSRINELTYLDRNERRRGYAAAREVNIIDYYLMHSMPFADMILWFNSRVIFTTTPEDHVYLFYVHRTMLGVFDDDPRASFSRKNHSVFALWNISHSLCDHLWPIAMENYSEIRRREKCRACISINSKARWALTACKNPVIDAKVQVISLLVKTSINWRKPTEMSIDLVHVLHSGINWFGRWQATRKKWNQMRLVVGASSEFACCNVLIA